jgi:hypothetical protein
MIIKSVHIKECWPFEYVAPKRRMHTEDAKKRQNELKRARYAKAVSIKTPKGKKLVGLRVFEMNDDICERFNNDK